MTRFRIIASAAAIVVALLAAGCSQSTSSSPSVSSNRGLTLGGTLVTNFKATVNGSTVVLTWTNPPSTARNLVFRGSKELADTSTAITTWADTNVPAGTYTYQVVPIGDTATLSVTVGTSPTTTTTVAPTTTTTTVPPTYSCVKAANGTCYFTADTASFVGMNNPYLTSNGTSPLGTLVNNDLYSPVNGETQTISANSAQQWQVTNSTPANSSVTTYPNAGTYAYTGVLDDYASLTSNYNLTMPVNNSTIAWATTDDWLSEPGSYDGAFTYEIQVHMDNSDAGSSSYNCPSSFAPGTGTNRGNYGVVATGINIGGATWFLCDGQVTHNSDGSCQVISGTPNCGELIFVQGSQSNMQPSIPSVSGTLDLKAMYQWLETHNVPGKTYPYMQAGSAITALSSGYEIVTTTGTTENFSRSAFTVNAVGAPTPPSSAPAGITFTAGSNHTCVLSWTGSGLATNGYDGYVYGQENHSFFVPSGTTSTTFTGTASGQSFNAELAFSNNGGSGPYASYRACTTT